MKGVSFDSGSHTRTYEARPLVETPYKHRRGPNSNPQPQVCAHHVKSGK